MSRLRLLVASAGLLGLATLSLAAPTATRAATANAKTSNKSSKPAAPAVARTPGLDLLDAVDANSLSLSSYDVQGTSQMKMGAPGQEQNIDVPFRLAGAKPARLRTEIMSPVMPFVNYSDGSKTWVFLPRERKYTMKDQTPSSTG